MSATVNYHCLNCSANSSSVTEATCNGSTSNSFLIDANEGFYFNSSYSAPLTVYNSGASSSAKSYLICNTSTQMYRNLTLNSKWDGGTVEIYCIAVPYQLTPTLNLENCTCNVSIINIYTSTTVNTLNTTAITLTANDGYTFEETPILTAHYANVDDKTYSFTISGDKLTATLSYTAEVYNGTDDEWIYSGSSKTINEALNGITISGSASTSVSHDIDYQTMIHCSVNSSSATSWNGTESCTISLSAEDGYYFPVNPRIYYTYVSDETEEYESITISTDKLTAEETIASLGEEITNVYVIAKAIPISITPNQDLTNCTSDLASSIDVVQDGDAFNITATANSNCIFETAPILTVEYEDTTKNQTYTLTISDDKTTATLSNFVFDLNDGKATFNVTNVNIISGMTLTATAIVQSVNIPVTVTSSNCKVVFSPELTDSCMVQGTKYTAQIQCNDYCFVKSSNSTCKITYDDGTTIGVQIEKVTEYTNDYESGCYSVANFIIDTSTSSTYGTPTQVTITVNPVNLNTVSTTISSQLEYCESTTIPETVMCFTDYSITITAYDGYYFVTAPTLVYQYTGQASSETVTFELSDDKLTATATFNLQWRVSDAITLTGSATPATIYQDKYGAIYIYNPTIDELNQFADMRFTKTTITATTSQAETYATVEDIDMGTYVVELHRFYGDIGETFESSMKIGLYDTGITTRTPYEDIVTVDCGTITLNGINNTGTDYLSTLKLFLPFIGFVDVNIDTTLYHELHLYYKATILNGEAIAILEVDNVPMFSWECTISQKILYKVNNEDVLNDVQFTNQFLMGFQPYALLTYYTDTNNNSTNSTNIKDYVKNMDGFFTMEELNNFSGNMLEVEREEIKTLLKEGCYYEQNN